MDFYVAGLIANGEAKRNHSVTGHICWGRYLFAEARCSKKCLVILYGEPQ